MGRLRLVSRTIEMKELVWPSRENKELQSTVGKAMELQKQTKMRAIVEKYRLRAGASVALGIHADEPNKPFKFAVWTEGPWEIDPSLEKVLEQERPRLAAAQKLPGRNDPCICGSGKKFKKCCLGKIRI